MSQSLLKLQIGPVQDFIAKYSQESRLAKAEIWPANVREPTIGRRMRRDSVRLFSR